MTLPFLLLVARAFACPSLDASLDQALAHALSADFASADHDLGEAEAAMACSEAAPAQVAHYLVVRGGVAEFGTPGGGVRFFASAKAIDPEVAVFNNNDDANCNVSLCSCLRARRATPARLLI